MTEDEEKLLRAAIKRTPSLSKHDSMNHWNEMVDTFWKVEWYENNCLRGPMPNMTRNPRLAMVEKWYAQPWNIVEPGYYTYGKGNWGKGWEVIDRRRIKGLLVSDCAFQSDVDYGGENNNWNKIYKILSEPENELRPQSVYMMVAPADRRYHPKNVNYRIFYVLFLDKGDCARFKFLFN
jgi:hypothetical protein